MRILSTLLASAATGLLIFLGLGELAEHPVTNSGNQPQGAPRFAPAPYVRPVGPPGPPLPP